MYKWLVYKNIRANSHLIREIVPNKLCTFLGFLCNRKKHARIRLAFYIIIITYYHYHTCSVIYSLNKLIVGQFTRLLVNGRDKNFAKHSYLFVRLKWCILLALFSIKTFYLFLKRFIRHFSIMYTSSIKEW